MGDTNKQDNKPVRVGGMTERQLVWATAKGTVLGIALFIATVLVVRLVCLGITAMTVGSMWYY